MNNGVTPMMDKNRTTLVLTWANIMIRCYSKDYAGYKDYGGRGILACERWHEFENFYQDMAPKPPGLSLNRINNDLGYSPENCEWADKKTQSNNRRSNVSITCDGETRNLAAWSELSG